MTDVTAIDYRMLKTPTEWDAYHDLRQEVHFQREPMFEPVIPHCRNPETPVLNKVLRADCWGIFKGPELIGFFGVREDDRVQGNVLLQGGFLLPDYRGKGLFSHAYALRLEWAKTKGFATAEVSAHAENAPTIALCKKHGFKLFETSKEEIMWWGGSKGHCHYYRRNLSSRVPS